MSMLIWKINNDLLKTYDCLATHQNAVINTHVIICVMIKQQPQPLLLKELLFSNTHPPKAIAF